VVGGGVGLASASDFVFATERSQFSLPEALWGLMPCCVLPFLIRRVGFQKACTMALSTQPVSAREAEQFHLVDKVTDDPHHLVRKLLFRASKLSDSIIGDLKQYLNEIAPSAPEVEDTASRAFARLLTSGAVQQRLASFATHQRFPWEG
jgi:polyketide biosynthesis enoyl-CoA hydratase PksH